METIKQELLAGIIADHGPRVQVELETTNGICFKIFLKKYFHYVTYIRMSGDGKEIHCHYFHKKDFISIFTKTYPDIQSYREQGIMQLFRRYGGRREDLVAVARAYMKDAAHRMWGYRLIGGSRKTMRNETFANEKWFRKNVPEPPAPRVKTAEEEAAEKAAKLKEYRRPKPLTKLQLHILAYQAMRMKR